MKRWIWLSGLILLLTQSAFAQKAIINSYNDFLTLKQDGINSVTERLTTDGWQVDRQGDDNQDKTRYKSFVQKGRHLILKWYPLMESYNSFLIYEDLGTGTELFKNTLSWLRTNSYSAGTALRKSLSNPLAAYEVTTVYKKMDTPREGHAVELTLIYGKDGAVVGYRYALSDI